MNIKIKNQNQSVIILDKIFINFHSIALQSNNNDDIFEELLIKSTTDVIELFKIKADLIQKRLNLHKYWNEFVSNIFRTTPSECIKNSLKSISFFGLNEAIGNHCGIELDRIETSEKFAINILEILCRIIEEKNIEHGENFIFSQPHCGKYLQDISETNYPNLSNYGASLIRKDTNLSIEKQINLFSEIQKQIPGGSCFYLSKNTEITGLIDILEKFKHSKLNYKISKEAS
jgi:hypothetical protein